MENHNLNNSNNNGNGIYHYDYTYNNYGKLNNDYYQNKGQHLDPLYDDGFFKAPTIFYTSRSPSPPPDDFIEHPVSMMDTLAGVAIKYGVEVADIKKMNGLVTDHQMFALKSLQIPLPGRHSPSSCQLNGHYTSRQQTTSYRVHSDLFDSFQSSRLNSSLRKVSPAMSSLQGYYGLKPVTDPKISEAFEIADRKGDSNYQEDIRYLTPTPASNIPLSRHRKSRSLVNCFVDENNGVTNNWLSIEAKENDSKKSNEKFVRRRQKSEADFGSIYPGTLQKSEADFGSIYPDTLMTEDTCGCISSAITGKSLALRSKTASRAVSPIDSDTGVSTGSSTTGGFTSVRKSSSASNLQDQESSNSSIWPASKWSLKQDLQALSAAAIARPIFDGLPKPTTSRRNKAALD